MEDFPLKINLSLSSYFPIWKNYLLLWSHSWSLNKNFSPKALKNAFKETTPYKYNKDLSFPTIPHKVSFKKSTSCGLLYPSPTKIIAFLVLKYQSMPLFEICIIFRCIQWKIGWSYPNIERLIFKKWFLPCPSLMLSLTTLSP